MINPKIALISGASAGLGKEIAPFISDLGFQVIKLGFKSAGRVDYRADLTNPILAQELISQIIDDNGEISLVIANAGGGKKPPGELSPGELDTYFMERNFYTAKNLISSSMESLIQTKGSVIAISSIVALKEIENAPTGYAKSKKALNSFIREIALEQGKTGVRANLISPGNIFFPGSRWDELKTLNPELVSKTLSEHVPLGNFITPAEIAAAIKYLSSGQACNITGTNIVIDGGQSL